MTETVHLTTGDGVGIVADFEIPDVVHGAAVVCHPHPQYGGNRFNNVVQALFDVLPQAHIATLRFDFRSEFGNGVGERLDAVAALDHTAASLPGVPMFMLGYSFGAAIALGIDDPRIVAKVLVAPPLAAMPVQRGMDVDTLILTPAHDQFSTPDATEAIVSDWPQTTHETITSADHFLNGRTATVAERAIDYLSERLPAT